MPFCTEIDMIGLERLFGFTNDNFQPLVDLFVPIASSGRINRRY